MPAGVRIRFVAKVSVVRKDPVSKEPLPILPEDQAEGSAELEVAPVEESRLRRLWAEEGDPTKEALLRRLAESDEKGPELNAWVVSLGRDVMGDFEPIRFEGFAAKELVRGPEEDEDNAKDEGAKVVDKSTTPPPSFDSSPPETGTDGRGGNYSYTWLLERLEGNQVGKSYFV